MTESLESRIEKLEQRDGPKPGIVVVYPETTDEEVAALIKRKPGAVIIQVVYEERKDEP